MALVISTGAHWAVLQSVAWTAMFAANLRTGSLTEALTHTFDGKHPCCLCKAIATGKKSEKKKEFTLQTQKLEFPPAAESFVLVAPSRFQLLPLANAFAESFTFQPPTPPPRNLSA
ncbi:MAG: hypothetical protein ACLP2Y_11005 [Limisphaerales bacterium]